MRKLIAFITLAFAGSLLAALPLTPAQAGNSGSTDGCTPGYWKNHTDNWYEHEGLPIPTSLLLESDWAGFDVTAALEGDTLLDALDYKGGSGADGAERILLRAAAAAWLNAAHEDLAFPLRRDSGSDAFVTAVNEAIASGDRARMLALAAELDSYNNLDCPLS